MYFIVELFLLYLFESKLEWIGKKIDFYELLILLKDNQIETENGNLKKYVVFIFRFFVSMSKFGSKTCR